MRFEFILLLLALVLVLLKVGWALFISVISAALSMCIGEGGEGRSAVPEEDSMNTHGSNSCVTEVF